MVRANNTPLALEHRLTTAALILVIAHNYTPVMNTAQKQMIKTLDATALKKTPYKMTVYKSISLQYHCIYFTHLKLIYNKNTSYWQ